jgi:hypothetical protein
LTRILRRRNRIGGVRDDTVYHADIVQVRIEIVDGALRYRAGYGTRQQRQRGRNIYQLKRRTDHGIGHPKRAAIHDRVIDCSNE